MGEAMVVIREYVNEMEALVARSVLETHQIPAVVMRDEAGSAPTSLRPLFPVRLAVRAADATRSLRILDAPFEGRSDGPGPAHFGTPPRR